MSGDDLHTIGDDYLERGGTIEGPIGRCSVCRLEVRWSEAARPLTTEPVHADCVTVGYRDHRKRTPPHGDALRPNPIPRRLPSHIERAARQAYAAGYGDRSAQDPLNERRGVEVFRASLEHDADEARRST